MKVDEIRKEVEGIPYMTFDQAKSITDVILKNKFKSILELGFAHGVSTCYMAGALDELGRGHITSIDLTQVRIIDPNIDTLLDRFGLTEFVTVFYEPTSYNWRLMKMLEEEPSPTFDFCYIDGAHTWFTDGLAFFLVDRLLEPGGLIIFDDLDWTYASSPRMKDHDKVKRMPEDEKNTPQIRKIYELLVKPHPYYFEFMEKDGWAYARKIDAGAEESPSETRKEIVYEKEYVYIYKGLGGGIMTILKRAQGTINELYSNVSGFLTKHFGGGG